MLSGSKSARTVTKMRTTVTWWRFGVGIALLMAGIGAGVVYMGDISNMVAAFGLIAGVSAGGAFVYWSLNRQTPGYILGNRKITGRENAIVHFARSNGNGKDVPVCTKFVHVSKVPRGARLHHLLNLKQHFYELKTGTTEDGKKGLVPVVLPDKKPFPPSKYAIAATMQQYKDAIEYVPPSTMQKIGPIAIVIAMVVVGLLIVVTTGGGEAIVP